MKNLIKILGNPINILIIIIAAAFAVRIYNLDFNSVFIDEAFYILIGQKILEGRFEEALGDITWLGGFPFFYPFLSGVFYNAGGLAGARFLNVLLGTLSVALTYFFTRKLNLFDVRPYNQMAGLAAAAFMASTAIPIEASRLAIYDGLSFALFLVGLNFFAMSLNAKKNYLYFLTAVFLFLSFLAKYITAIFFPAILIAALVFNRRSKEYVFSFLWAPLIFLTGSFVFINYEGLMEFLSTQVADPGTTYGDVVNTIWQYSWVAYILAIPSAFFLWSSRKKTVIFLALSSLIPVFMHVFTRNDISAHQHVFLSLVFIVPFIGALFVLFINKFNKFAVLGVSIILLVFYFLYSWEQVKDLESFWPNTGEAARVLKEKVEPGDFILAEGSDSILLSLDRSVRPEQIAGPFVFNYGGDEGPSAYVQAIEDNYFRFIELENAYFSEETLRRIEEAIAGNYFEIFNDGTVRVYERIP